MSRIKAGTYGWKHHSDDQSALGLAKAAAHYYLHVYMEDDLGENLAVLTPGVVGAVTVSRPLRDAQTAASVRSVAGEAADVLAVTLDRLQVTVEEDLKDPSRLLLVRRRNFAETPAGRLTTTTEQDLRFMLKDDDRALAEAAAHLRRIAARG